MVVVMDREHCTKTIGMLWGMCIGAVVWVLVLAFAMMAGCWR